MHEGEDGVGGVECFSFTTLEYTQTEDYNEFDTASSSSHSPSFIWSSKFYVDCNVERQSLYVI